MQLGVKEGRHHARDLHLHRAGDDSNVFGLPLMLDEHVNTDHLNDDHSILRLPPRCCGRDAFPVRSRARS
ncbi:MAG: hypothetical protein QOE67_1398 [Solirubrobacteraceae bacterium]|nr:hypothetical protein [Solirubrobacteraceae bacterium]